MSRDFTTSPTASCSTGLLVPSAIVINVPNAKQEFESQPPPVSGGSYGGSGGLAIVPTVTVPISPVISPLINSARNIALGPDANDPPGDPVID